MRNGLRCSNMCAGSGVGEWRGRVRVRDDSSASPHLSWGIDSAKRTTSEIITMTKSTWFHADLR